MVLAFSACPALASESNGDDSLAFELKRKQILESSPGEKETAVVQAADELARDGYYVEALELIYDMQDTAATAKLAEDFLADTVATTLVNTPVTPAPPAAYSPRSFTGYVRSAFTYDDWYGQDNPIGGETRARLEWTPASPYVDRVYTTLYGSDRAAYFGLNAKGSAFHRMLKFEGDGTAEKKLGQSFGDSLDRFYFQGNVEAGTRPLGKPVSVVLPARIEAQQYRIDRSGLSYRTLAATPGVEMVSGNLRRALYLNWDVRETSFPSLPSSGYFRNGPTASAEWFGEWIIADAEAQLLDYRYARDTSLYRRMDLESRGGAFIKPLPWFKAGFRGLYEKADEHYRDSVEVVFQDTIQAAYPLHGTTWMLQPTINAEWRSIYSAYLALAFTRGRFPILSQVGGRDLAFQKYMQESYDDLKPEAGFTILSKAIFFNLSVNYEFNHVSQSPLYSIGYSEGIGGNGNLFWKFRPWLEVELSALVERRMDKLATPGRIMDMTSLSMGLTSRFQ